MKAIIAILAISVVMAATSSNAWEGYTPYGQFSVVGDNTGLMWEDYNNDVATYSQAVEACENMTLDGFDDWRLPTTDELLTLRDLSIVPVQIPVLSYDYRGYWAMDHTIVKFDYTEVKVQPDMGDTRLRYAPCVRDAAVAEPVLLVVEKTGFYTAEFKAGYGVADVYVNDQLVGSFLTGIADIGNLTMGDTIEIILDGKSADSVEQLDWQSWNLYWNDVDVQIYVEDPPVVDCTSATDEAYVKGYSDGLANAPINTIERIVEVPVEVEKIVEVPSASVCDDLSGLSKKELKKANNWCRQMKHFEDKVARLFSKPDKKNHDNKNHK